MRGAAGWYFPFASGFSLGRSAAGELNSAAANVKATKMSFLPMFKGMVLNFKQSATALYKRARLNFKFMNLIFRFRTTSGGKSYLTPNWLGRDG